MEKALSWSSIKPDDTKTLQAYTLFLRGCCNAMEDVNNMQEFNMSANLLIIIKTLPYRLRDKWRSVACDFQERYKQRATFSDLVNYHEKQVRIATDPVFGDIRLQHQARMELLCQNHLIQESKKIEPALVCRTSKDCRKRLGCNICNLKHPWMLHIHQRRFEMDKHQAQTKEEADIRAIASVQTSSLTGSVKTIANSQ